MPSSNSKVSSYFFTLKNCACKLWIYYLSSKWVFINDFLVCSGNSMVHIGQCKQGSYWDLAPYVEAFLLYGGLTCFCDSLNFWIPKFGIELCHSCVAPNKENTARDCKDHPVSLSVCHVTFINVRTWVSHFDCQELSCFSQKY